MSKENPRRWSRRGNVTPPTAVRHQVKGGDRAVLATAIFSSGVRQTPWSQGGNDDSSCPHDDSESLLEGPQVHLMCPGAAGLFMQMPVGIGNGIRIQQPVLAGLLDMIGSDRSAAVRHRYRRQ